MTEYHVERIFHDTLQEQLNILSEAGWELVCAHAHPFETNGAQIVLITYWKRVT